MSQVIYARVRDTLKEAADIYADERGVTLTAAVVDLLERGLSAATDERSVSELERKLAAVAAAKVRAETELKLAASELSALRAFAQRSTETRVGKCPNPQCAQTITGYDLLGTGSCGHCGSPLLDLLAPTPATGLEQREFGLLVGALGAALVGAVLLSGKATQGV